MNNWCPSRQQEPLSKHVWQLWVSPSRHQRLGNYIYALNRYIRIIRDIIFFGFLHFTAFTWTLHPNFVILKPISIAIDEKTYFLIQTSCFWQKPIVNGYSDWVSLNSKRFKLILSVPPFDLYMWTPISQVCDLSATSRCAFNFQPGNPFI